MRLDRTAPRPEGDPAAAVAWHATAQLRAAVTTEVVVELGETNLWVTLERAGSVSRPLAADDAAPGQFPAQVRVSESGQWRWGSGRNLAAGEVVVGDLLSRVDDPVPMVVGGDAVLGAEAVARQVAALWQRVAPSAPSRLTLVHPVDLSRRGRMTVERHLVRLVPAVGSIRWVSRAAAAVAAAAECADLDPEDQIGVLHVGGRSVEAVVGTTAALSSGAVHALRVDHGGAGHAVDDTLLAAVRTGGEELHPSDLEGLRRECERAKIALSSETSVDLDVRGMPVRLVRADLEELSARLLARQLDTLETVRVQSERAGSPLRLILLVGGAAAAPALVEAASARFELPVVAVPRLGDAVAERLATGTIVAASDDPRATEKWPADPDLAPDALTTPRGAVAAVPVTDEDDSLIATLARSRRQWAPTVPLSAATAGGPRALGEVDDLSRFRTAPEPALDDPESSDGATPVVAGGPPGPTGSTPSAGEPRSGARRAAARFARVPMPRPTHLAAAAGLLIAVAAVPVISGALGGGDGAGATGANGPNSVARAGSTSGLFGGSGLGFSPGAAGDGGPSGTQSPANPTGTLGPHELSSMVKPGASTSATSPTPSSSSTTSSVPTASPMATGSTPAAKVGTTPAGAPAATGGSTAAVSPSGSQGSTTSTPAPTKAVDPTTTVDQAPPPPANTTTKPEEAPPVPVTTDTTPAGGANPAGAGSDTSQGSSAGDAGGAGGGQAALDGGTGTTP